MELLEGYGNSLDVTIRTHFTQQLFQPPSDRCFWSYLATIHVDSPHNRSAFFQNPGCAIEILNHSFIDSYLLLLKKHPFPAYDVSDSVWHWRKKSTWKNMVSEFKRFTNHHPVEENLCGKKKEEHWVNGSDGREKGREDGRDRHLIMKGKASVSETVSDKNSLNIKDNLLPM